MIGRPTVTREFAIYKMRSPYTTSTAYVVELDGVQCDTTNSVDGAHRSIKAQAKRETLAGAGVTEVFGRNRTFIITPRFGFKRWTA